MYIYSPSQTKILITLDLLRCSQMCTRLSGACWYAHAGSWVQVSPWHQAHASDVFFLGRYQCSLNRLKDAESIQRWDFKFEIIQPWYWCYFPCQDEPVETFKVLDQQLGYIAQHSYVMSHHVTWCCVMLRSAVFHLYLVTCVVDSWSIPCTMTRFRNEADTQMKAEALLKGMLQEYEDLFFTGVADTCKFDVELLGYVVQSACGRRMCRKCQQMNCQRLQQRDCIYWTSFCT